MDRGDLDVGPFEVQPSNIGNAPHYVWAEVYEGWRLLDTPHFSVLEERVPPGRCEVAHFHSKAWQFFYVLAGIATMRTPAGDSVLKPGDGLKMPPGHLHQFRNDGAEDVRVLVISTPSTRGDRTTLHAHVVPLSA